MTEQPAAAPAAEPMVLTIEGTEYRLAPTTDALIAIERITGRTIYNLLEQVRSDTLSLLELGTIVVAMAGAGLPADSRDVFATAFIGMQSGLSPKVIIRETCDQIVSLGVVKVTATIVTPLAAAVAGKVDRDGRLIAAAERSETA